MGSGSLGDLERLVLLAVLRRGDDAYAVTVRDEIEERAARTVTRGAVYVTLDRLERKGYLSSHMSAPIRERGGKARRLFRLEPSGREALQQSLDEITGMMRDLDTELRWDPA